MKEGSKTNWSRVTLFLAFALMAWSAIGTISTGILVSLDQPPTQLASNDGAESRTAEFGPEMSLLLYGFIIPATGLTALFCFLWGIRQTKRQKPFGLSGGEVLAILAALLTGIACLSWVFLRLCQQLAPDIPAI